MSDLKEWIKTLKTIYEVMDDFNCTFDEAKEYVDGLQKTNEAGKRSEDLPQVCGKDKTD